MKNETKAKLLGLVATLSVILTSCKYENINCSEMSNSNGIVSEISLDQMRISNSVVYGPEVIEREYRADEVIVVNSYNFTTEKEDNYFVTLSDASNEEINYYEFMSIFNSDITFVSDNYLGIKLNSNKDNESIINSCYLYEKFSLDSNDYCTISELDGMLYDLNNSKTLKLTNE